MGVEVSGCSKQWMLVVVNVSGGFVIVDSNEGWWLFIGWRLVMSIVSGSGGQWLLIVCCFTPFWQ